MSSSARSTFLSPPFMLLSSSARSSCSKWCVNAGLAFALFTLFLVVAFFLTLQSRGQPNFGTVRPCKPRGVARHLSLPSSSCCAAWRGRSSAAAPLHTACPMECMRGDGSDVIKVSPNDAEPATIDPEPHFWSPPSRPKELGLRQGSTHAAGQVAACRKGTTVPSLSPSQAGEDLYTLQARLSDIADIADAHIKQSVNHLFSSTGKGFVVTGQQRDTRDQRGTDTFFARTDGQVTDIPGSKLLAQKLGAWVPLSFDKRRASARRFVTFAVWWPNEVLKRPRCFATIFKIHRVTWRVFGFYRDVTWVKPIPTVATKGHVQQIAACQASCMRKLYRSSNRT